jgi:hypothetical protein
VPGLNHVFPLSMCNCDHLATTRFPTFPLSNRSQSTLARLYDTHPRTPGLSGAR